MQRYRGLIFGYATRVKKILRIYSLLNSMGTVDLAKNNCPVRHQPTATLGLTIYG